MARMDGLLARGERACSGDAGPLDMGGRKQLFIDHRFIAAHENVELHVNPPVKRPGAVIQCDKLWDAFNITFLTVAEDDGIYKMWYHAFDGDQWTPGAAGMSRLCYAVSRDGLSWEKPSLGIVDYEGSNENNILIENMKTGHVFIDPHGRPEERYKIIYTNLDLPEPEKLRVGVSDDGVHWRLPTDDTAPYAPDSQQIAFWDGRIGKYVVYLRSFVNPAGDLMTCPISEYTPEYGRAVSRVELDDIVRPWTDKDSLAPLMETVLRSDELDPPDFDIYTSAAYQYPYAADAYFMFPMVYQHLKVNRETSVPNDGVNDGQLCASRDGIHWMRYDRRTYLERGLPCEPDCGICAPTGCLIRRGDYLHQYYRGWPYTHGGFRRLTQQQRRSREHWGRSHVGVAAQRLDGFVSADAPLAGGYIITPPIVFSGEEFRLNINVSANGEARAEIQDANGEAVGGYSLDECDRIMWNDVAHTVKWRGKSDVSSLAGQPVRIRIVMRAARLYAFQFVTAKAP